MLLSVVMPVFNEVGTIDEIVKRVCALPYELELIIIDDGSSDGTRERYPDLQERYPQIELILHEVNQGKGAALRTGFRAVKGDIVIIQDADLEYDPREYQQLLVPLLDGRADVVYGSRFLGGPHRVHLYWHYVANRGLTMLSNMFTNLNLTDMETCYKAFRSHVVKDMPLRQNRFGFEPEFTARVAHRNLRVYEVPISYSGRDYAEGKKIGKKDGVVAVWVIVSTFFEEAVEHPEHRHGPLGFLLKFARPVRAVSRVLGRSR